MGVDTGQNRGKTRRMDDIAPPRRPEAVIVADLAVADAEIAGGLTVAAADVLADLDAIIVAALYGQTDILRRLGPDRH